MILVAFKMLLNDRSKFMGLIFGIAFTSFLASFAVSYFCGFMTDSFALISENKGVDIWVMDPAVSSVEQTINMDDSALGRVRSIPGVLRAMPLLLGSAEARFPNGQFQTFQIIGVDDATLEGAPTLKNEASNILRMPDAAIVDEGGTSDKLLTPIEKADQWPFHRPHLDAPTRMLTKGDELQIDDHRVLIVGRSSTIPRYPATPLLYTTYSNALLWLPPERENTTFILVTVNSGINASDLAEQISRVTGLRARTSTDFIRDTVKWVLINSEDVGDIASMLLMAITVGFGVTGIMLYMFTTENLKQYATLSAMGATSKLLIKMIFAQALLAAFIGTGIGLGLCAIIGEMVIALSYPFRMMWFTPLAGSFIVVVVSVVAALLSAWPVLKLKPAIIFSQR